MLQYVRISSLPQAQGKVILAHVIKLSVQAKAFSIEGNLLL